MVDYPPVYRRFIPEYLPDIPVYSGSILQFFTKYFCEERLAPNLHMFKTLSVILYYLNLLRVTIELALGLLLDLLSYIY